MGCKAKNKRHIWRFDKVFERSRPPEADACAERGLFRASLAPIPKLQTQNPSAATDEAHAAIAVFHQFHDLFFPKMLAL
jgi:hypothetical protein